LRRRLDVLLLLLLVPLVVTWPALPDFGSHAPMAPEYEGATHAWGLWAALMQAAPVTLHTELLGWPDGGTVVLVDPANLPAFALGYAIAGLGGGLTALTWAGVALAGLGGALLARELDGDTRLGALAAMLSTPVLCAGRDGITEDLAVGLVAVQLALLLRALRTRRAGDGLLASLALAASFYGGPYNGLLAGVIDGCIGLSLLLRRDRRALRAAGIAAGAAVLVAPLARSILSLRDATLPGGAARGGLPLLDHGPDRFRGGLMGAADLLDPWLPAPLTGGVPPVPHSAYLGVVALGAAILAVARDRRRWPWLAGALALVLIALGPHLYLKGEPLRIGERPLLGPAGLLILALPTAGRLTRWYRAAGAATLLLAGLSASATRSRRGKLLLAGLLLLDALLLAPVPWPRPSTPLPSAAPWAALPSPAEAPGAILELPLGTAGSPGPGQWRDVGLLDQIQHQRPIGGTILGAPPSPAAPEGRDALRRLIRTGSLPADARRALVDAGFSWVLIRPRYLRLDATGRRHLDACLGPPLWDRDDLRLHALSGEEGGCSGTATEAHEQPPR